MGMRELGTVDELVPFMDGGAATATIPSNAREVSPWDLMRDDDAPPLLRQAAANAIRGENAEPDGTDALRSLPLPGVGHIVGAIVNSTRAAAQKRIDAGKGTEDDYWTVAGTYRDAAIAQQRQASQNRMPGYMPDPQSVGKTTAFMLELYGLAPAAKVASAAVGGGVLGTGAALTTEALGSGIAMEAATSRAAPWVNAQGQTQRGMPIGQAALSGFADAMIEVGVERAGEHFYKIIPKTVRDRASRLWGVFSKANPGGTATEFANLLRNTHYDGLVSEVGEERLGEILAGAKDVAFGDQRADFGATGDILSGDPKRQQQGLRQIGQEVATFAPMAVAGGVSNVAENRARGQRLQEIRTERGWQQAASADWAMSTVDELLASGKTPEQVRELATNPTSSAFEQLNLGSRKNRTMPTADARRAFGENALKYLESIDATDQEAAAGPEVSAPVGEAAQPSQPAGTEAQPANPDDIVTAGVEPTAPSAPVAGFTTAQGSTYEVDDQGRTTRTKSLHAGHDAKDVGQKRPSEATYYIDPKDAQRVGMWQTSSATGKRTVVRGDEALLVSINPKTGEHGIDERIKLSQSPAVGLSPLELWSRNEKGWWRENHPGSPITEIRNKQPAPLAPRTGQQFQKDVAGAPPAVDMFGQPIVEKPRPSQQSEATPPPKQEALFDKRGKLGQMNAFDDVGVPDDMVVKQPQSSPSENLGKSDVSDAGGLDAETKTEPSPIGRSKSWPVISKFQAAQWDMTPEEYTSFANQVWEEQGRYLSDIDAARKHAQHATKLYPSDVKRIESSGQDYTSIPSFDVLASEIANSYPALGWQHLANESSSRLEDKLWDLLKQGQQKIPSKYSPEYHDKVDQYLGDLQRSVSFDPNEFEEPGQQKEYATSVFQRRRKGEEPPPVPQAAPPPAPPPTAAPSEFEPVELDDGLTSIKNEVVNELRQRRGLDELPGVPAQAQEEWLARAVQKIRESNGAIGPSLIAEIQQKPRNLNSIEVAVLQLHYRGLNNAFNEASQQLFEAVESQDQAAIATAQGRADDILSQLDAVEQASKAAGREWGRAGVARQIALAQDFSLGTMIRRAMVANAGQPLSQEQTAQVTKLASQVEALEKQLAESEAKRIDAEREKKVAEGIAKDVEEVKKRRKSVQRQKAESKVAAAWAEFDALAKGKLYSTPFELAIPAIKVVKAYVDLGVVSFGELMVSVRKSLGGEKAEKARATFQMAWNSLKANGEISTADLEQADAAGVSRLARKIQRTLVESGITSRDDVVDAVHESLKEFFPEITRRETMDALSGYGLFTPLSNDEISRTIRDINGQLQQLAKLDDMQKGQAPAKTGPERRTPSDEERRLIQQVNEAKRRGGFNVTDPAKQLATALSAAKTATRNRIADLEHEIETKERIVRDRTAIQPDAELEALRKQRDELRVVHKELFPPKGMTQEQKIAAASRALDKAIQQIEAQIKSGDVEAKGRPATLSTPEIDAKRGRLEALREQRNALRDPGLAYKASLKKRIADYQQRLANGEFEAKPKNEARPLTREELNLKRQLDDAKHDFFEAMGNYRLKRLSPLQKLWDYAKEAAHFSRAVMTSFDLSAVFRQGGIGTFSHPVLALKAARKMLAAFAAKQAEFDSIAEIRNRPNAQLYETARLAITEQEGRLTRQEEAFMGRWGRKVAPIRASARAYTTFLNNLRADMFDSLAATLGAGDITLDEAKAIATYVNVATGRADLGKYNSAMANLNTVFFAPRFVASRFQYLAMPAYLPFTKASGRVKRAIAMEYARYAMGVGLFIALAVGLGALADDDEEKPTVEFDPRSSDFGKIKIGETRIDPLSGLSQVVVFLSRLASGQTKDARGQIQPLRGPGVRYGGSTTSDVIKNFARSKLAPVPGSAVDLLEGKNVVGENRTPIQVATDAVIPLSLREVLDAMRTLGVSRGAALGILNLFGMGTAAYGPRTEYLTGTEEERQKIVERELKRGQAATKDQLLQKWRISQ